MMLDEELNGGLEGEGGGGGRESPPRETGTIIRWSRQFARNINSSLRTTKDTKSTRDEKRRSEGVADSAPSQHPITRDTDKIRRSDGTRTFNLQPPATFLLPRIPPCYSDLFD